MIRFVRDLRLIPIALIASACLLALKTADLVLGGGALIVGDDAPGSNETAIIRTTPDMPQSSGGKLSWAQQMFNFPDGSGKAPVPGAERPPLDRSGPDITGSIRDRVARDGKGDKKSDAAPDVDIVGTIGGDAADSKGAKDGKDTQQKAKPTVGTLIPIDNNGQPAGAERAILERLQERRQELDTRARELDIRESLIKAAEKRMEAQLAELKEVESRITVETQQKDDAQAVRFKGLVTMYENMKPREAAKIFDRLEIGVLLDVASKINPRQMADILAQMSPDAAERLTVEMASKARDTKKTGPADLPKIEGRPTSP
jgi:flagellar motility protein MotE (MotC chaperone)